MKKISLFIVILFAIPCLITWLVVIACPELKIGRGDNPLENISLGKTVSLEINGLYKTVDVEEYVAGVLPGVMSAEYDSEALKLQAILIRTNVLREMEDSVSVEQEALSYTYLSVEERVALWGDASYEQKERKIEQAVVDTAGEVLLGEDGNLIMAVYHEVSIGKTASAKEVLGKEISYLQSVESSQDVEAKHYMNEITYTWEELQQCLPQKVWADTEETGTCSIEVTESTENGFVRQVTVNATEYSGEEAMELFQLPSNNFYVEEQEDGVRFICLGRGNCLGVSQYGANAMAQQGKTAQEILQYYYQGVTLEKYRNYTKSD